MSHPEVLSHEREKSNMIMSAEKLVQAAHGGDQKTFDVRYGVLLTYLTMGQLPDGPNIARAGEIQGVVARLLQKHFPDRQVARVTVMAEAAHAKRADLIRNATQADPMDARNNNELYNTLLAACEDARDMDFGGTAA